MLVKHLANMTEKDMSLGIIEAEGLVGEVDPKMVVMSAITAFDRGITVCFRHIF